MLTYTCRLTKSVVPFGATYRKETEQVRYGGSGEEIPSGGAESVVQLGKKDHRLEDYVLGC